MNPSERLDITSTEAAVKVAQRALYDHLQSSFDLHAGRLVKDLRDYAQKHGREDVDQFAVELRGITLGEFDHALTAVHGKLNGSSVLDIFSKPSHPKFGHDIRERFNLNVPDLAESAVSWCEALGIKPGEFVLTTKPWIMVVVEASFDKAIELLRDPQYRG